MAADAPGAPRGVLCYGDSLTAGLCEKSMALGIFVPYAEALGDALDLPCRAMGASGARTDELERDLDQARLLDVCEQPYSGLRHVLSGLRGQIRALVLMAGTNDLADPAERSVPQIVNSVMALAAVALSQEGGPRVAVLSVPPSANVENSDEYAVRWRQLNAALAEVVADLGSPGSLRFFDLTEAVPFDRESGDWMGDGLHMSSRGYARFGEAVAAAAGEFLRG